MRPILFFSVIFLVWAGVVQLATAGGDTFAAVSGTGWTDISKLESTCSRPGYFTNPSDCTKFYNCVDHSTPEHQLYLRYDFECAAGTAFDETNSICNYPGPNGCISSGGWGGWNPGWNQGGNSGGNQGGNSGWNQGGSSGGSQGGNSGWNQGGSSGGSQGGNSGWNQGGSSGGSQGGNSGWNQGSGSGWSNKPGIWQNTVTISKTPSWGVPAQQTVVTGVSSTPAPFPSNPRLNFPTATRIVHVPTSGWESSKIRNSGGIVRVTTVAPSGSWSGGRNVGVFESAKVITHQGPSVTWGTSKVIPVQTGVFQGPRVTPVPPAEWEIPPQFPVVSHPANSHTVVQVPNPGWTNAIRVTPSPAPVPANPIRFGVIHNSVTVGPPAPTPHPAHVWSTSIAPPPAVAWQGSRITQVSQGPPQNPSIVSWQAGRITAAPSPPPSVQWQSVQAERITASPSPPPSIQWQSSGVPQTQGQEPVRITWGAPQVTSQQVNVVQTSNGGNTNPAFSLPAPPGGWENSQVNRLPSGYSWQSNGPLSTKQSQGVITTVKSEAGIQSQHSGEVDGNSVQSGDFGIVKQVINEGQSGEVGGKSHIQLIYETKERQNANQVQTVTGGGGGGAQGQTINEIQQAAVNDPSNPVYEIVPSASSGIKGRIFVLYAPFNKGPGGKRDVPVIEVQIEDDGNVESEGNIYQDANKK